MKITFVTHVYPYPERGYNPGVERVVQEFARELVRQDHEVHVVTTYRNGGVKKFEVDKGVQLHRVSDTRRYFGKIGSLFSLDLLSLNHSLTEYSHLLESSDIVHTFTPIIWKFFSTPLLAHYHHWDDPSKPLQYLYLPTSHRLWMRCYMLSDMIIAVSEYSATDLSSRGVNRNKIEVVPNGVDISTYQPGPSSIDFERWETILLYVGPLAERKGLKYLIGALPTILEKHPDTGLVLVGGGDNENLVQLAERIGVRDRVSFEGFVPENVLPDYYRAADVFVFPSLLEGFGMVLVEAMASGLPVVSTTATAIPEVVGDAGLLVPPRDEDAFASAVSSLIAADDYDQWCSRSRMRVQKKFTWTQTTHELCSLYEKTLSVYSE